MVDINNMDKKIINNLSEGQSIEDIEKATNDKAKIYYDDTDGKAGFHDNDEKEIYINAGTGSATDTEQFITTYGHENAHNYSSNESLAENTGSYANTMWGLSNMFNLTGTNTTGTATSNSWYSQNQNSSVLINNNNSAGEVQNSSDRVTVQVHEVAFGNYHTSIKIEPDDQETYKEDFRFIEDKDGNLYSTIGAGPTKGFGGKLESDINREKDKNLDIKVLESLPLDLKGVDENKVINHLFETDKNYKDDLEYSLFPQEEGKQYWNKSYNSNSYVSGLLNASGQDIPNLNKVINLPGYDKPVPAKYFEGEK
jgi:hypothetical protein